jgi:predicted alpha-1,2-mannosidase
MLFSCGSSNSKKEDLNTADSIDATEISEKEPEIKQDITFEDIKQDVEIPLQDQVESDSIEIGEITETETKLISYVNPIIGTGGLGFGVGSALPGAAMPFGMVKVSPDSSNEYGSPPALHCSGYYYDDTFIDGFSQVHMHGTGVPDYGLILLMPTVSMNQDKITEKGYRSLFDHAAEFASPGYYSVILKDYDIKVELTAKEHSSYHRYTFHETDEAYIILDVSHTIGTGKCTDASVKIKGNEVSGFMFNQGQFGAGFPVYFYSYFSSAPEAYGTWNGLKMNDNSAEQTGADIGAYLKFKVKEGESVEVRVGISYISIEQAKLNIDSEIKEWGFEKTRAEAENAWEKELSMIEIEGGTEAERIIFYTSMYHVFQMPTLFTDVNGKYIGMDKQVHDAKGFTYYTDFSLWDTFRTEHPFFIMIQPQRQRDMVVSMIKMYEEGGCMPKWPLATAETNSMIGSHADSVIADSYIKGIKDFDTEKAFEGMSVFASGPSPSGSNCEGRPGIAEYLEHKYVPADNFSGSTSVTLEYAYDDFCIAEFAKKLNKFESASQFEISSKYYKNVYNPETGFFQGRHADGKWVENFSADYFSDDYVEGNAWQYFWFVPHDVKGLSELVGGSDKLIAKLDTFFALSEKEPDTFLPDVYYWHGNEPDIHAVYMFMEAGNPSLGQKWVRWIMKSKYGTGPDGLDGNDDCGTLSSWYIFSAVGFYPVPCRDVYFIGSPLFKRTTIHLPGGKDFIVEAENTSEKNIYVKSAKLKGKELKNLWFTHEDLLNGGILELEMSDNISEIE